MLITRRLTMLVLVLVVMMVEVRSTWARVEASCAQQKDANITAPNLAPEKYFFSSGDCCGYCLATDGCVAATYSDYMCSPKGSLDVVSAKGAVVLIVGTLSPSGPTSTSKPVAPTTARPTTSTTAAPPHPTTPAPPPKKFLIATTCSASSNCSRAEDTTCISQVKEFGVCYPNDETGVSNRYELLRGGDGFEVTQYPQTNCTGGPVTTREPRTNVCELGQSGGYIEYSIVTEPTPSASCPSLMRSVCSSYCAEDVFQNGGCELTGSYHSNYGASTRVLAGDAFVWWRVYQSDTCSGEYVSLVDPLNTTYLNGDGSTVLWTCLNTTPATPTPKGAIALVADTTCSYASNCSVMVDGTCRTHAAVSGTCVPITVDSTQYSEIRTCVGGGKTGFVLTSRFEGANCAGAAHERRLVQENCSESGSGQYEDVACIDVPLDRHRFITWRSCVSTSPPVECRNALYLEGQCMATSQNSDHQGNSIVTHCSSEYVWWRTFQSADCSGPELQSRLEPIGSWFEAENSYSLWACEEPPQTTAVPSQSVSLLLHETCSTSATCDVSNDTTCSINVFPAADACNMDADGYGVEYLCFPDFAVRRQYLGASCKGRYYEVWHPLNHCSQNSNGDYHEFNCLTAAVSSKGNPAYPITLESCSDSSAGSGGCTNTSFTPGICQQSSVLYCLGQYVWRQDFEDSSCQDSARISSRAHPVGVRIASYSGYSYWSCSVPRY